MPTVASTVPVCGLPYDAISVDLTR